jgi:lipopolysaccharide export system protein LptA
MSLTIRKLRVWIVGLAILLVAVLALFIVYGQYKAHQLIADLPAKIDKQIERSSKGFTYSKSNNGRTAFTIQASRADQFKGGSSATLHDVVITLYGAEGDRSDRISGSEFDYDQKADLVTAKGEVQIDLQSANPAGAGANTASGGSAEAKFSGPAQETIHIKTSGLVFNQRTQIASTTQYVEFTTPKASGHSTGATYDVQKGLLVLNSAVELTSSRDGDPIKVHASHAEFLRASMQAFLLNPLTDYKSQHTSAEQAIVYLRRDGSAEHVDAKGHVRLTTDNGQQMTAEQAKMLLDQRGNPVRAEAGGGLNFVSNSGPQHMHGNAVEGTLIFAAGGLLQHAQARNAVSFVDQLQGLGDDPQGSATRELRASQVDIDFVPDSKRHTVAEKVLAGGGATAVLHTIRTKAPSQNTTIKGDQLLAALRNGKTVTSLHGTGHTSLQDVSPSGATNFSSGDTLQVNFAAPGSGDRPAQDAKQKPGASTTIEADQVESAVQEGNVLMVQTPAPDAATSKGSSTSRSPTRATARRVEYTGATQILRLTGSPRINDGTTDLAADAIDYHRDTANADAVGNVKATYLEPKAPTSGATPSAGIGGQGPTHIISNSASLDQAHALAVFRGQARLWQGPNSVAAPVIELQRDPQTLKAYGDPSAVGAVYTVIANNSGSQQQSNLFRVHSRQLLYEDAARKATFTGAVVAEDPNGIIHCDQVETFLVAANNPQAKPAGSPQSSQSRLDRVVAAGHVVLEQPGRRGTGEKLLYTAQDGKFVLTGTSSTPPHLYDQAHGTVTGDSLIFNTQDDSVSVAGGQAKSITDTRTAK